jgi:hypothetical protein
MTEMLQDNGKPANEYFESNDSEHVTRYKSNIEVKSAKVCGDPHFMTWTGKRYDYHGECDLVFARIPLFCIGQGLDIHVRTDMAQVNSSKSPYSFV